MIVVRAPLRISFVGGGSDLPDYYNRYTGRVISATIDKYVYVVINRTPLIPKISARYSISETVNKPTELQHTRIKATLLDLKIGRGVEIASFASLPAKTGLGSSSSFSVALIKALHAYRGEKLSPYETAELASRLEIDLLGEPIGKQDQYAASFGGLNIFEFNKSGVEVKPIALDFTTRREFENHLLVFFTGITREAPSVLKEQKQNIKKILPLLKRMAKSANEFSHRLQSGDFKGLGTMLDRAWADKKKLAKSISNAIIDDLYQTALKNGAWGGKVLGAGGGGCMLFITPQDAKVRVAKALKKTAAKHNLVQFREIPTRFVQSGAEILFNADYTV